ncbi:hypothetical protein BS78_06G221400 [Paspalum vaginatum]|nr:hypothetical protein BS78_06G221400 [Paspalum vaginatum]
MLVADRSSRWEQARDRASGIRMVPGSGTMILSRCSPTNGTGTQDFNKVYYCWACIGCINKAESVRGWLARRRLIARSSPICCLCQRQNHAEDMYMLCYK